MFTTRKAALALAVLTLSLAGAPAAMAQKYPQTRVDVQISVNPKDSEVYGSYRPILDCGALIENSKNISDGSYVRNGSDLYLSGYGGLTYAGRCDDIEIPER